MQEAIAISQNTSGVQIAEWADSLKRKLSYRTGISAVNRAIASQTSLP